jgi:hypothetical protein
MDDFLKLNSLDMLKFAGNKLTTHQWTAKQYTAAIEKWREVNTVKPTSGRLFD